VHGLNQRLAAMSSRVALARAADALMTAVQVLLGIGRAAWAQPPFIGACPADSCVAQCGTLPRTSCTWVCCTDDTWSLSGPYGRSTVVCQCGGGACWSRKANPCTVP
jgi:hypothetical protein